MKLLSEELSEQKLNVITESDGPNGRNNLYITGIFAEAERKNRNGRIYPLPVMRNAISTYIREYVDTKRAAGELNHAECPFVNMERACILVEDLKFDNNFVLGKAKVLSTPIGNIIKNLINDSVSLGISSRGLGDVEFSRERNAQIIQDNYSIQAFDLVSNPSGIDCFVNGIYESLDFYIDNGVLKSREAQKIHENIKRGNVKKIEADMKKFFKSIKI